MKRIKALRFSPSLFSLLVIVLIAIRFVYLLHTPVPYVGNDGYGYYGIGISILKSDAIFLDDSRPPVYPVFINIIMKLTGNFQAEPYSPQFYSGIRVVILTQMILSVIGYLMLYQICRKIGLNQTVSFLISLLAGCNIMTLCMETTLMTESLTLFLLITIIALILWILQKPSPAPFIGLTVVYLLTMFTKPLYAALPFIFTPVIVFFYRKTPKVWIYSSIHIVIVSIFIIGYCVLNNSINHYPGLSRIGDYDLLGQILHYNLPIDSSITNHPFYYDKITSYRREGGDPMPFKFLVYADPYIYENKERLNEIRDFNKTIIFNNLPIFVSKSLGQTPQAFLAGNDFYEVVSANSPSITQKIFQPLFYFFKTTLWLTFIVIPSYILILVRFLRKQSFLYTAYMVIGTLVIFQILSTVFFLYYDFGRILSVTQPFLYLISFVSWVYLIKYMSNSLGWKFSRRRVE